MEHVALVRFLRRGESGFVHAVVDVVVGPVVGFVDLGVVGVRVEVEGALRRGFGEEVVEGVV